MCKKICWYTFRNPQKNRHQSHRDVTNYKKHTDIFKRTKLLFAYKNKTNMQAAWLLLPTVRQRTRNYSAFPVSRYAILAPEIQESGSTILVNTAMVKRAVHCGSKEIPRLVWHPAALPIRTERHLELSFTAVPCTWSLCPWCGSRAYEASDTAILLYLQTKLQHWQNAVMKESNKFDQVNPMF